MEADLQHVYDSLDSLADKVREVEFNLNLLACHTAKQWVGRYVTIPAHTAKINNLDGDGPYRSIVDNVKGTTLTFGCYTGTISIDFFTILEEELQ